MKVKNLNSLFKGLTRRNQSETMPLTKAVSSTEQSAIIENGFEAAKREGLQVATILEVLLDRGGDLYSYHTFFVSARDSNYADGKPLKEGWHLINYEKRRLEGPFRTYSNKILSPHEGYSRVYISKGAAEVIKTVKESCNDQLVYFTPYTVILSSGLYGPHFYTESDFGGFSNKPQHKIATVKIISDTPQNDINIKYYQK